MITLVIIHSGNTFLAIEEKDGWYLPAGRVDYGESFMDGAIRESKEEAGIPVRLTGIYRIEHTGPRCRVLFGAEPTNDTPLKTIPDDDSLRAEWITLDQLKERKHRHSEVGRFFNWVAKGAPLYDIAVFEGKSGTEIDHKLVITYLVHTSKVVLKKGNQFLGVKDTNGISIPARITKKTTKKMHANS